VPQFEVEQAPNAIIVVAILGSMLAEELFYGGALQQSSVHAARFQKQVLDGVQLSAPQPATPRRWKS
jgi:hypothetical protein